MATPPTIRTPTHPQLHGLSMAEPSWEPRGVPVSLLACTFLCSAVSIVVVCRFAEAQQLQANPIIWSELHIIACLAYYRGGRGAGLVEHITSCRCCLLS